MTVTRVQAALGLGTAILAFAGAVAGATMWFSKRFTDLDTKIQKLDSAIRVLNINQPDAKYQELVKQLMAERSAIKAPVQSKKPAPAKVPLFGTEGVSASSSATKPPR